MQAVLDQFNQTTPDIQASAIFSMDGMMLASTLGYDESPDEIGAIVAALQSLGGKTSKLLRRGQLQQSVVQGDKGGMIVSALNDEALLIVLVRGQTNMGLLLHEIQRLQKRIGGENLLALGESS